MDCLHNTDFLITLPRTPQHILNCKASFHWSILSMQQFATINLNHFLHFFCPFCSISEDCLCALTLHWYSHACNCSQMDRRPWNVNASMAQQWRDSGGTVKSEFKSLLHGKIGSMGRGLYFSYYNCTWCGVQQFINQAEEGYCASADSMHVTHRQLT